ncbi:MAG: tetratricopeptide repeat protein [Myxococcota bacterium]
MSRAIFSVFLATSALGSVRWYETAMLDEALELAARQGKLVLVDVYATWCGPCHAMDREVYSRDDVAAAIDAGFVPLRVDGEAGLGAAIVEKYRVVGYPTLLALDAEGREIERLMGDAAPDALVKTLADWRAGRDTLAALEASLAATPDDLALAFEVGRRHAVRGHEKEALRLLGRVERADPQNARGLAAQSLLVVGKYLYVRGLGKYRKGLVVLERLERLHPSSPEAAQTVESKARAYHRLGDTRRVRAVLDGLIEAAPRDAARYNTYAWFCYQQAFDRARGIAIAQQGLEIDPKNDGLWDTLAELHFASGLREQALLCERRARELAPDEPYYARQLERFTKAPCGPPSAATGSAARPTR